MRSALRIVNARLWRQELIEPATERKRRAHRRRRTFKSAHSDPYILPQCNIFAISVSHRSHPETTRSVSKHTHNTPRFSNSPTVRRRPYRHHTQLRTPVFRALPSGLNFRAASRLRSVSSSLRGLNDAWVVDWWISVSNLQLAALTF